MKLGIDKGAEAMKGKFMEKRLPIVEQCVGCDKVDKFADGELFSFCKSYINPVMWWKNGGWCALCSTLIPVRVGMTRDKKYKTQKTWTIEWMPATVAKDRGFSTKPINPLKVRKERRK